MCSLESVHALFTASILDYSSKFKGYTHWSLYLIIHEIGKALSTLGTPVLQYFSRLMRDERYACRRWTGSFH